MAAVVVTSLAYDGTVNLLTVVADFSAVTSAYPAFTIVMEPEAIGNRIVANGYANGDEALTALVLEHVDRLAPDAAGTTVDWQSPSDEEKAAQLDALADRIEAARVFYSAG